MPPAGEQSAPFIFLHNLYCSAQLAVVVTPNRSVFVHIPLDVPPNRVGTGVCALCGNTVF